MDPKIEMSFDDVAAMYADHGYRFYDDGPYNANLFAIRQGYEVVDEFNDPMGIAYLDQYGNKQCQLSPGTTKPGLHYLKNKLGGAQGTAILVPGYYKQCWMLGKHRGQYEALVQSDRAEFKVWRDHDMDGEFDIDGPIYDNVTGLNGHAASLNNIRENVGPYSAGCQVRQWVHDHWVWMSVCKASMSLYGKYLSYALFMNE